MELTVGSHSIAGIEFLPNPPALPSQVLGLITRTSQPHMNLTVS